MLFFVPFVVNSLCHPSRANRNHYLLETTRNLKPQNCQACRRDLYWSP
jgi:hypothetical protein